MRFALRNKAKLIQSFGVGFYNELYQSLDSYFKKGGIQEQESEGKKYRMVVVRSVKNPTKEHTFAIVGRLYDVYRLAYYPKK